NFQGSYTKLATLGHSYFEVLIAKENAFPDTEELRDAMCSCALTKASKKSSALTRAWEKVEGDEVLKATMLQYVWGAASQLRGEVKSKADGLIDKFEISGELSTEDITVLASWLMTGGKCYFAFGGINYKVSPFYLFPILSHRCLTGLCRSAR
ncbi:hypothetical protein JAAARDRAFT_139561, partial [Jaapia argillacea MUCL 33604]